MDFMLEKIRPTGFLGFQPADQVFQVWHEGDLVGHVWATGEAWFGDVEPNLQPLFQSETREGAAAAIMARL